MPRTVDYEIAESVERPGFFDLWRIVRVGDREHRRIIDQRCAREPLEQAMAIWKLPGGWVNFF